MPDQRIIGPPTAAEMAALNGLFGAYLSEFGASADPARVRTFLQGLLAEPWIMALVARNRTGPVAFALGNLTYSPLLLDRALFFNDLYVMSEHRNGDLGSRMLDAVGNYARQHGITRIFGNAAPTAATYFLDRGWVRHGDLLLQWDL